MGRGKVRAGGCTGVALVEAIVWVSSGGGVLLRMLKLWC
jgi:hypothetical protein